MPPDCLIYLDNNVHPQRVLEITPEGEEAWSYTMKDANIQPIKVLIR